jgi:GGDEF domain-containing protein
MGFAIGLVAGLVAGAVAFLWAAARHRAAVESQENRISGLNRELITLRHEARESTNTCQIQDREIQQHRDLAVLLPELVKQIFSARTSTELADYISRAVNLMTGTERIAVFLADRTGKRLGLMLERGLSDVLKMPLALGVGEGHVGFAAETGRVFSSEEFAKESILVKRQVEESAIPGYVPELAAPMSSQGVLYGVLCLSDIPRSANLVRERVRAIAAFGAAAYENIRLLERFETAADLDTDTALPGKSQLRPRLDSELERVRRFRSPLSLLEIQLPDCEKSDRLLAKEVMRMCANHLKATMRNIDTGLRTSRDRLLLLLPGTGIEGAIIVVERLGEDLPGMANEEGDRISSIRVRRHTSEPEDELTVDAVMQKLEQVAFEEYTV